MNSSFMPCCPKCGYRLDGEVSRWKESCPLELRCAECGKSHRCSTLYDVDKRVPWAFDVRGTRGLAPRRWWLSTFRLLRPSRYWCAIMPEGAIAVPTRVWLWAALLIGQFHLLKLLVVLFQNWRNVQRWSTPGDPFPFWNGRGPTLEILSAYLYDAGEMRRGVMTPLILPDRFKVGLAVGGLAVGALIWILGRRGIAKVDNSAIYRAMTYGMLPIAIMYVWGALQIGVILMAEITGMPTQWWWGTPQPQGFEPGVALWAGRLIDVGLAIWVAVWWWTAAAVATPGASRWTRCLIASTPVVIGAGCLVHFLVRWNLWTLP